MGVAQGEAPAAAFFAVHVQIGDELPSQKNQQPPMHHPQQAQQQPQQKPQESESMLSFVPEGILRSIVEYLAALIPGSALLFAFFIAAQLMVIMLGDVLAVSYFLAACVMPVLAGVVSALVLERLRKKPLSMQRGAMVGAAAGIFGAAISSVALITVSVLAKKAIFGAILPGLLAYAVLAVIVLMDTILGALGGVIVVKFLKEQQ
ncbi:MAG: hypothetical protein QW568_02440 [Candidatus Anstonellaceae archaeon]